jgi:transcriptional regulator with XRE-family HTH domain
VNYEQLGREFVRALRGKRSQVAFSRRLGYRTNVVYAWESGRRWPTAAVALRAAATALRIDLRARIAQFYPTPPDWLGELDAASRAGVARFLSDLRGKTPIVDLARRAGLGRYTVSRWLSGSTEPRLPDFLRLLEATSLRLLDFVALFTDPDKLPAASEAWKRLQTHRRAAYELPWLPAVLRSLELDDYVALEAHRPGWIAKRLGISTADESRCIEALARTGQIRKEGKRWVIDTILTVDTRQDRSAERQLKTWWAKVGLERLTAGADGLFSFNVFTVSSPDLARLRELHLGYFRAMRAIIAESSPSHHVVVANLQLFALDAAPKR